MRMAKVIVLKCLVAKKYDPIHKVIILYRQGVSKHTIFYKTQLVKLEVLTKLKVKLKFPASATIYLIAAISLENNLNSI